MVSIFVNTVSAVESGFNTGFNTCKHSEKCSLTTISTLFTAQDNSEGLTYLECCWQ